MHTFEMFLFQNKLLKIYLCEKEGVGGRKIGVPRTGLLHRCLKWLGEGQGLSQELAI